MITYGALGGILNGIMSLVIFLLIIDCISIFYFIRRSQSMNYVLFTNWKRAKLLE